VPPVEDAPIFKVTLDGAPKELRRSLFGIAKLLNEANDQLSFFNGAEKGQILSDEERSSDLVR
jgi:hypothetical protein